MRIIRCFLTTAALVCLALTSATAGTIDRAHVADIQTMIGKSSTEIVDQLGTPAETLRPRTQVIVSEKFDISLLQMYDFHTGGRVGFLLADDTVTGILFDRMLATKSPAIADFFPHHDPRRGLMVECEQSEATHSVPGQPRPLQTIAAEWATEDGGIVYARFRTDGDFPTHYDADLGKTVTDLPKNLDRYALLQFGYFPLAGSTTLANLSLSDVIPNTNFSMVFDPIHEVCAQ